MPPESFLGTVVTPAQDVLFACGFAPFGWAYPEFKASRGCMAGANEINFRGGRLTSVADQFKNFLNIEDVACIVFSERNEVSEDREPDLTDAIAYRFRRDL
jgi:hypothetical protein